MYSDVDSNDPEAENNAEKDDSSMKEDSQPVSDQPDELQPEPEPETRNPSDLDCQVLAPTIGKTNDHTSSTLSKVKSLYLYLKITQYSQCLFLLTVFVDIPVFVDTFSAVRKCNKNRHGLYSISITYWTITFILPFSKKK